MHAATWESLNRFVEQGEITATTIRCDLHVARSAVALERVPFQVSAHPGTRVRATLHWFGGEAPLRVDNNGDGAFVPDRPGKYRVSAQAIGENLPHAEPQVVSAEAWIDVEAPPVSIDTPLRVVRGIPGSLASFRWAIRGADHAEWRAHQRDQVIKVPLTGGVDVDVDVLPESFHLVAIGMDGVEHEVELSTAPAQPVDADLRSVLRLLNTPWS